jgi:hypothetical protein
MVNKINKIHRAKKLPSLLNWALNNFPRLDDTARKIRAIAENPPRSSVRQTNELCARIAYGELTPSQIAEQIELIGRESSRRSAREVIPAFVDAFGKRGFPALPEMHGTALPLPIGRSADGSLLLIPIRPDIFVESNGRIMPVFFISWTDIRLSDFQRSLLSSIIKLEFLSQQDFIASDCEIWCFPRMKRSTSRDFVYWNVNSSLLMDRVTIQDQFERYTKAVSAVIQFFEQEPE